MWPAEFPTAWILSVCTLMAQFDAVPCSLYFLQNRQLGPGALQSWLGSHWQDPQWCGILSSGGTGCSVALLVWCWQPGCSMPGAINSLHVAKWWCSIISLLLISWIFLIKRHFPSLTPFYSEISSAVCWSHILPALEGHLFTSLPNPVFIDVALVAWNWPSWENLHQGHWQMMQIRAFPLGESVVRHSPAHLWVQFI